MNGDIFQGVNFGWGMLAHIYPGGQGRSRTADALGGPRWNMTHFHEHVTVKALMVKDHQRERRSTLVGLPAAARTDELPGCDPSAAEHPFPKELIRTSRQNARLRFDRGAARSALSIRSRALRSRARPLRNDNLASLLTVTSGSMMSFLPVTARGRDVARQREVRQRRQRDVVRPANARLQHAAAPHRNAALRRRIVDRDRLAEAADAATLMLMMRQDSISIAASASRRLRIDSSRQIGVSSRFCSME
jgi:hypothetical protein